MNTASRRTGDVGRVEQVVAPHDRPAQRALALGEVGRPCARLVEPTLEPLVDRRRREEANARRGQLDRERHAAEMGDDRRDVAAVRVRHREPRLDRARASDEQPHRLEAERGPPARAGGSPPAAAPARTVRAGRGPAGSGARAPGTPARPRSLAAPRLVATMRIGHARAAARRGRSRRAELLEVVDHEEGPLRREPVGSTSMRAARRVFPDSDRAGDRGERDPCRRPSPAVRTTRHPGTRRRRMLQPGARGASCRCHRAPSA